MQRVLRGNPRFGMSPGSLVAMGDVVFAITITSTIAGVAVPLTPDVPAQEYRAGALGVQVAVGYMGDVPDRLLELAWDAQRDTSTAAGRKPGELYFAATRYPGAVHAVTNPEWGGWVLVENVGVGGASGTVEEHTVTWRGRDVHILT